MTGWLVRSGACLVAALAAPGLAPAGDASAGAGVTEINHVRATAGGVTPADGEGYPVTLAVPGSYRLTGPLSVADPNASAIEITADDVTIDLNGFLVSGPISCTGSGAGVSCMGNGAGTGIVASSHEGVVIQNGAISGFGGGGISLAPVESCRLAGLNVVANGSHGIQLGGSCQIEGLIVDANRGVGFFVATNDGGLESPIDDVVVRESVISQNFLEGVFTTSSTGRDRFSLVRSTVWANGLVGVELRSEGDVLDSAILGNPGGGIRIGINSSDPDSGLVRGNAVQGNGFGFQLDPAHVGYVHNNFDVNAGASSGGVQLGPNVCGGDTTCP
jgi:hypothetical protein